MIGQIENNAIDICGTFTAWFDITIRMLQKKIITTGIRDWTKIRPALAGQVSLFDSLRWNMQSGSELIQKGIMAYNLSGKFADMGVGRNYAKGNTGNIDAIRTQRKRREWQSKLFYAQVMVLGEIMKEKIGESASNHMVALMQSVSDLKYAAYSSADRARNARNYQKQINLPLERRT